MGQPGWNCHCHSVNHARIRIMLRIVHLTPTQPGRDFHHSLWWCHIEPPPHCSHVDNFHKVPRTFLDSLSSAATNFLTALPSMLCDWDIAAKSAELETPTKGGEHAAEVEGCEGTYVTAGE